MRETILFLYSHTPIANKQNANLFAMNKDEIRSTVRAFLIDNIFGGKDDGKLQDDTALISSRIMDSIIALKLVSHLEDKFHVELEAHEVDQDNLDTINKMVEFISSKGK